MEWILIAMQWYWPILVLGLIGYPLVKKIFRYFPDNGYAFAKTISILLVCYSSFVLGGFKLLPFTQFDIILMIGALALVSFIFIRIHKNTNRQKANTKSYFWVLVIFEELLFFLSFLFWTYIRSQEPSLRSLEKFMDFGFINSILRSTYFPPADIWYPPFPINYYYFGHLTGATLIKLTGIKPAIGYNLILATLFALGITQTFSLIVAVVSHYILTVAKTALSFVRLLKIAFIGLLGSFFVNLGGNLHTIYLFTTGYPNDNPIPFWKILSAYNPAKYWYPNATRFIPYTIHEFPSYSYVVADLHGHVFDIPFVLLTLALLFIFFISSRSKQSDIVGQNQKSNVKNQNHNLKLKIIHFFLNSPFSILYSVLFGFMTAVHYMTNAFDGPIYLLLITLVFFVLFGISIRWIVFTLTTVFSFVVFSLPFSRFFTPFVNGIGVNCSPKFLTNIGKIGPFLFEKNNCQISPIWMLFVLWGFFWISFILLLVTRWFSRRKYSSIDIFMLILFSFGIFLTIIPEFFYIKDIYPLHFRANTMFKLGYQAFIMMSVASTYVFFRIKILPKKRSIVLSFIFIFFFIFVAIYPLFSIPSYYGSLTLKPNLDGSTWLKTEYPEDKEIIDYLNQNEPGQPVILEAQGDSYTDFERISANTGLPTVAGWWVHEWLWRGSSNIIAERIPDVVALYESADENQTKQLIQKYHIKYVIIGRMERQKYANLNANKFAKLGRLIYRSNNGFGALYQLN